MGRTIYRWIASVPTWIQTGVVISAATAFVACTSSSDVAKPDAPIASMASRESPLAKTAGKHAGKLPRASLPNRQKAPESEVEELDSSGASSYPPDQEYASTLDELETLAALYRANLRQIELARFAEKKGASLLVRRFGQRLRMDKEFANRHLLRLVNARKDSAAEATNLLRPPQTLAPLYAESGEILDQSILTRFSLMNEEEFGVLRSIDNLSADDLKKYARIFLPLSKQLGNVANEITAKRITEI